MLIKVTQYQLIIINALTKNASALSKSVVTRLKLGDDVGKIVCTVSVRGCSRSTNHICDLPKNHEQHGRVSHRCVFCQQDFNE